MTRAKKLARLNSRLDQAILEGNRITITDLCLEKYKLYAYQLEREESDLRALERLDETHPSLEETDLIPENWEYQE